MVRNKADVVMPAKAGIQYFRLSCSHFLDPGSSPGWRSLRSRLRIVPSVNSIWV